MNISNLELAQATMEIFGGCICLMLSIMIIMNRHNTKSMRVFIHMFVTSAFLFFFEACAYIFRGNTNTISLFMTRASNFAVFAANVVLAMLYIRYIYSLLQEKKIEASRIYGRIADIFCFLAFGILLVNLVTGWMYSFDENNYYSRDNLWYIYTVLELAALFTGCFTAFKYRRQLDRMTLLTILFFSLAPIIATIIQTYVYGLAITNFGIAVSVLVMLIVYLFKWSREEYVDQETDERKRKLLQTVILFVLMVFCMSASIISCVISLHRVTQNNAEDNSKIIAHMVENGIENEFLQPIMVARTMAKDEAMLRLMQESSLSPKDAETAFSGYLTAIKNGFQYQMAFAISDVSLAYHTYEGINKIFDLEQDPHDIWYKLFRAAGKEYELNIDTDEVNALALSVFVNTRVEDEQGHFLGACGVGVRMDSLEKLLMQYEQEHNIQIALVDRNGVVQVASDRSRIEKDIMATDYFSKVVAGDFFYQSMEGTSRLTSYMKDLDWYLVIVDLKPEKINLRGITTPSIVIFILGLFMMAIAFGFITMREQKVAKALREKRRAALTDELTGLWNRHAYEEDLAEIERTDRTHEMIVVMLDVNGLKTVNDSLGHNAGDELIIGAGNCMLAPFAGHGKIYRVGGDEFVVLLRCSKEKFADAVATFEHVTANWKGSFVSELSISKGSVIGADHPEMTLHEMIELADKLMYADKDEYYRRTGKKRR